MWWKHSKQLVLFADVLKNFLGLIMGEYEWKNLNIVVNQNISLENKYSGVFLS